MWRRRILVPMIALASVIACGGAMGCLEAVFGVDFDVTLARDGGASADGDTDGDAALASPFTTVQELPVGADLVAIWGADRDHVFAVGTNNVTYVYRDGAWTLVTSNAPGRDYSGVCGLSPTNVFAVGTERSSGGGFIDHFDGTAWSQVFTTPAALHGCMSTPDQFVLAVGAQGGLYAWHAGETWQSAGPLPANTDVKIGADDPVLWAIAGRSFDDFGIAAGTDRIFHAENQGFASYDPAVERTLAFHSVWQAPAGTTNLYFGTNFYGLVWFGALDLSPDPAAPEIADAGPYRMLQLYRDEAASGGAQRFINGIWGTAKTLIAVGDEGHMYRYDVGGAVAPIASPTTLSLGGAWGSDLADVWIVGEHELILHGSLAH